MHQSRKSKVVQNLTKSLCLFPVTAKAYPPPSGQMSCSTMERMFEEGFGSGDEREFEKNTYQWILLINVCASLQRDIPRSVAKRLVEHTELFTSVFFFLFAGDIHLAKIWKDYRKGAMDTIVYHGSKFLQPSLNSVESETRKKFLWLHASSHLACLHNFQDSIIRLFEN